MFELVRNLWTSYTRSFDPGSIYSGTIYAVVSLVFWVYYAALIFIIGGEVSQAQAAARAEAAARRWRVTRLGRREDRKTRCDLRRGTRDTPCERSLGCLLVFSSSRLRVFWYLA
jgi:hypothetical protein